MTELTTLTDFPTAPNPADGEDAFDALAYPFTVAMQAIVPELRAFGFSLQDLELAVAANAVAANIADVDLSTITDNVLAVNPAGDGFVGIPISDTPDLADPAHINSLVRRGDIANYVAALPVTGSHVMVSSLAEITLDAALNTVNYVKIGPLVIVHGRVRIGSVTGTPTRAVLSLPFQAAAGNNCGGAASFFDDSANGEHEFVSFFILGGSSTVGFNNAANRSKQMLVNDLIDMCFCYTTDE